MSPCSTLLLPPQTLICSNNGVCINHTTAMCSCTAPWTSRGDFRYEEGLDCDVYPDVIRSLYSISLFGMVIAVLFCLKNMRTLVLRGDIMHWFSGPGLIHQLILYFAILHSLFDILKIVDPVYYCIGLEPVSTWLLFFGYLIFYVFGFVMTNGMLALSLKQSMFTGRTSTKALLLVLRFFLPTMLLVICIVHTLCTVGGLYLPMLGLTFLFATLVSSAVCFLLFCCFKPIALGHILVDMEYLLNHARSIDSPVSPHLVQVYKKLKQLRFQYFVQPALNGIISLLVALWPFLIRKT